MHNELTKLFKPSSNSTLAFNPSSITSTKPVTNAITKRKVVSGKKPKGASSAAEIDDYPLTIFSIPSTILSVMKEKEKQNLRKGGRMKFIQIYQIDSAACIHQKILRCFPAIKK